MSDKYSLQLLTNSQRLTDSYHDLSIQIADRRVNKTFPVFPPTKNTAFRPTPIIYVGISLVDNCYVTNMK